MTTKYRVGHRSFIFNKNVFTIEKYVHLPDGPNDYNGMPTSLAGWAWVACDEFDIPDLYALLNASKL